MDVVCPSCGAGEQQVGKYCENCGYLIPAEPQASAPPPWEAGPTANLPQAPTGTAVRFALMREGQPSPSEGFTINRPGEFLVGRIDQDSGSQVDVDLRQWVTPLDVHGQKQYLVHRKQCFIGLAADGTVTIRAFPGYEADTLVRGAGENTFTALQSLAMLRQARPDGSFALKQGDQIFMGDPSTTSYYLTNDPTAKESYAVLQLVNTP